LFVFIAHNFTYPPTCATYTGKIYMQFVIEKDGSLSNIEVVRSPEHFDEVNKEALRVFGLMPNWKPGQNRGKPERVRMVLPINIRKD
jgi:protein TonB